MNSKEEVTAAIEGFDEEGEIEITEAFSEGESGIYDEVKSTMEKKIYQFIT